MRCLSPITTAWRRGGSVLGELFGSLRTPLPLRRAAVRSRSSIANVQTPAPPGRYRDVRGVGAPSRSQRPSTCPAAGVLGRSRPARKRSVALVLLARRELVAALAFPRFAVALP